MTKLALFIVATITAASQAFAADCETLTAQTQETYTSTLEDFSKRMDGVTGAVNKANCAAVNHFLTVDAAIIATNMTALETSLETLKTSCPLAKINDEEDGALTPDQIIRDLHESQIISDMMTGALEATAKDCKKAGF